MHIFDLTGTHKHKRKKTIPEGKLALGLTDILTLVPLGPQGIKRETDNGPFSLVRTAGSLLGFLSDQTLLVSVTVGGGPSDSPGVLLLQEVALGLGSLQFEGLMKREVERKFGG